MQPVPAAVTAWRKILSCTSPAAKTPAMSVAVESGRVTEIALAVHRQLALEQLGVGRMADGDEHAVGREMLLDAGLHVLQAHARDQRRGLALAGDLLRRRDPTSR